MTFLLGVLAQREATLASGLAVGVTVLLVTRGALHHFVGSVLTEQEVHDALLPASWSSSRCCQTELPDRSR